MAVIWELDFYSRPILDENGKKRWEILICEGQTDLDGAPEAGFRYARYFANTEVNSLAVRSALQEAMAQSGQVPQKVRFFRQSMKNAITKGCEDAGLTAIASYRALTLAEWLRDREATVYPQEPGYQAAAATGSVFLPPPVAQPLPDALLGQKWAFVNLPLAAFGDWREWEMDFGEGVPLAGLDIAPEATVPGILVFSPRAKAIAAWMSGLEMGFLTIEQQIKPSSLSSDRVEFPDQIILETGVGDRWVFANLPEASLKAEGARFMAAKEQAKGLHFIAVQQKPEEERFAGFWLMVDLKALRAASDRAE
ncbi:MAG: Tab2/Atab2 family RNA-binding protein [Cyanophyceae cyanobacterium]